MLVIDDAHLLVVLAAQADADTAKALEDSEVFTTSSWYWRLARAIRDPRSAGVLTRAFAQLSRQRQQTVLTALEILPAEIGMLPPRALVPIMSVLDTPRRLNFLSAEALATALLLDATVVVSTESELLREACGALGVPIRRSIP